MTYQTLDRFLDRAIALIKAARDADVTECVLTWALAALIAGGHHQARKLWREFQHTQQRRAFVVVPGGRRGGGEWTA